MLEPPQRRRFSASRRSLSARRPTAGIRRTRKRPTRARRWCRTLTESADHPSARRSNIARTTRAFATTRPSAFAPAVAPISRGTRTTAGAAATRAGRVSRASWANAPTRATSPRVATRRRHSSVLRSFPRPYSCRRYCTVRMLISSMCAARALEPSTASSVVRIAYRSISAIVDPGI